jgi:two-component system, LytTR family, response regulator
MPDVLRVLIADDEPLARDCVRLALRGDPSIEIAGECGDGAQAKTLLHDLKPDLLFLDVQMPGADGFAVIEDVAVERMPAVIFVTAYDRYAVRAFELHAVDYLLKPFDNERLLEAVARVRAQIEDRRDGEVGRRLAALLREVGGRVPGGPGPIRRFAVRGEERVHFVTADEVDWIEADGNYVVLHVGAERHRVRIPLRSLIDRLDLHDFAQVHRSAIVNLQAIRELQAWFGGDYIAVLRNGEEVRVSRTHAPRLLRPAT